MSTNTIEDAKMPDDPMQRFIASIPAVMAMFDRDMRYVAWSQEWAETYGLAGQDLRGKRHYDLFPDLPQRWIDAHRRGLAGEQVDCDEDLYRYPDGSEVWMSYNIRPVRDATGEVIGIVLKTRDITLRKRALTELNLTAGRLEQVTEALDIGIFEADLEKGTQIISDSYRALLDIDRDQLPATLDQWIALLRPSDLAAYLRSRAQALDPAGDGRFQVELRPIVAGQERTMTLRSRVFFEGEGAARKPVRVVGILQDVTENRLMQQALSRAQRLETIGRMAGMVTHDFNNILTVILANLELAELRVSNPEVKSLLRHASEAADMGAAFNRRLLALSGGHPATPYPLVMDTHLAEVWELFFRVLSDVLTLHFSPGTEGAVVMIDPLEIDGALLNLVVNARDAQPGGGQIVIRTAVVDLDQAAAARIRGGRPGHYLQIAVCDEGTGMTEEALRRLGEPFFSTKGPGRGTGLGVTSASLAAERAGGFLGATSVLGKGSEVSIYLPISTAAVPEPVSYSGELPMGDGELILVVEDDAMVREAAILRLEALGYAVIEAANGDAALDLLRRGEPVDMVFSDVVMPGKVSGFDIAAEIRARFPGIAVLLTSGHVSSALARNLPDGSRAEILSKPYPLGALAEAVARTLSQRRRDG